jgi:hypothetical protein
MDVWHHMGWGGVEAERGKVGGDREKVAGAKGG